MFILIDRNQPNDAFHPSFILLLMTYVLTIVSGQFKMDINGHEKSPQHGRVKEEKSSPTRIELVTITDSRGEQA